MSVSPDDHRRKPRAKGVSLKTAMAHALALGCQLLEITSHPGGILKLKFGHDGEVSTKGNSFADIEAGLERRVQGNG